MPKKRFKYSYSLEKVYDCNTFNGETTESYGTFECCDMLNQLNDENEQLKKELGKFKEWEKHIRDVKREELDRVFKMSIYEIAEAFEYYKERIKKMERELEELDGYKPYSIKKAKKPYICFNKEVLK